MSPLRHSRGTDRPCEARRPQESSAPLVLRLAYAALIGTVNVVTIMYCYIESSSARGRCISREIGDQGGLLDMGY